MRKELRVRAFEQMYKSQTDPEEIEQGTRDAYREARKEENRLDAGL